MEEYGKIVPVGEVCTMDFAKSLNIFDSSNYFIDSVLKSDGSNIKVYNGKDDDNAKTNSICSLSDDKSIAYENCAYKYNNPYLVNTIIDGKSYCKLPEYLNPTPDYTVGKEIYKLGEMTKTSFNSEIYNKYSLNQLCEERWHDWFCIPDYHIGNKYFNEVPSDLASTKSVGTCFTPCPFNYVPRDDNPSLNKCIIKSEFRGGIFAGTFNYTPMALICLFGLNEEFFKDNKLGYPNYMNITSNIIINDKNLKFNNNEENPTNIIDYIKDPKNGILDNIWKPIKEDISTNCNKIHEIIPDIDDVFIENNIIEPDQNIRASYKDLTENILFSYNLSKKIKYLLDNKNENPLDNNYEDYKKWKRGLMDINPKLTKELLKYHVKIFKKCANICFDGKSSYSKDYILYTLKRIYNIDEPIIFEDIDFDPEDEEIIINTFNIKPKKESNFFESYTNDFYYIRNTIDAYIISILLSFLIIILFIIYITYYEDIISIFNYIYITILWLYFDIRSFIYYRFIFFYYPDDTDMLKKDYIRKSYSSFVEKDKEYLKRFENN
uniref:Uncharacterized protein n=1 Tax=viral metagenome TaxID=1070528 RepID=A0A6C0IZZ7_9ZZZZ